jgi:hypothetical protein
MSRVSASKMYFWVRFQVCDARASLVLSHGRIWPSSVSHAAEAFLGTFSISYCIKDSPHIKDSPQSSSLRSLSPPHSLSETLTNPPLPHILDRSIDAARCSQHNLVHITLTLPPQAELHSQVVRRPVSVCVRARACGRAFVCVCVCVCLRVFVVFV